MSGLFETKDLFRILSSMINDEAETHTFKGFRFDITASNNPAKIIIHDKLKNETKTVGNLNSLELSLMALISALADRNAHECEVHNDKKS